LGLQERILIFSRRELLRLGLYSGAAFATRKLYSQQTAHPSATNTAPLATTPQTPTTKLDPNKKPLTRYVDPLPIPPVIRPAQLSNSKPIKPVPIAMRQFHHKAHRDLPPTSMWGYNGMWPGPTIEVRKGQPLTVKWTNNLPAKHFLTIDTTIHGAEADLPEVRTIVHVHGAQVLPENDGYPEAWITPDGKTGPTYDARPPYYPNEQPATMLWYHDHTLGLTRLNVYAGLAGMYVIRDEEEDRLDLPSGTFEIPLLIQDRTFGADGTLLYPPAVNGTHPAWVQEFFGENVCVNGKAMPYLEVEPRKYRFRLVNGSNARFYHLSLVPTDNTGNQTGRVGDAPPFFQIGTDGGLLPAPLRLHFLVVAPGERFDLIVDFSEHQGKSLAMVNDAPAPYARGGELVAKEVMLFKVTKPLSGKDTSALPDTLVPFSPLDPAHAASERILAVTEMDRPSDGYTIMGMLGMKHWTDPITEDPKSGSTEIWSFANATGDVHPIHIHLVRFQVLNRQPFDVTTYLQTGKVQFTGMPIAPETNERPAWKDTIKTYPGYITRVIQKFDLPPGTQTTPGQEFRYVWHCHILEHEDNEMMRPYKVVG
jgi:spore coat protein A, manganese oxidase